MADADALYRRVFDEHPAAQLLVDARDGTILRANDAATVLHGSSGAQLDGTSLSRLIDDGAGSERLPLHERLAHTPLPMAVEQEIAGRGRVRLEVEGRWIDRPDGPPVLSVTVRDITDLAHSDRLLRNFEELFENIPIPFYRATTGPTGRFLRVNPAFVRLLDATSAEELYACDVSGLYVEPAERAQFSNMLMEQGEVFRHELRMMTVTGRPIRTADTAFLHLDEHGEPVIDGALEDITRRRELEEELSYQARFDALTDLVNRRHCEALLQRETERSDRYGQPLSVLMIDVDHFKRINDEHGHAEGDRVLAWIAEVLRNRVRQTDIAARWGGEEFMVLLPATPTDKAQRLAEELRRAVAEDHGRTQDEVTISIGYAGYVAGEKSEGFLRRLDRALYAAKDAGRNSVVAAELPRDGAASPDTG